MRSIPTIFLWDKETHLVIDKPLRMTDWVFQGKGIPTRMYDGLAILVDRGKVYRRYLWKGGNKAGYVPVGFTRCQDPNPKRPDAPIPGWVPIPGTFLTAPNTVVERALKEAWDWLLLDLAKVAFNNKKAEKYASPYAPQKKEPEIVVPDGTYELCGPKIKDNHEGFKAHVLLKHGADIVKGVPRTFEKLKAFMEKYEGEGIVWHYRTGSVVQMAKIKRSDFGFNTRVSKEDLEMAYRQEETEKKHDDTLSVSADSISANGVPQCP